MSNTHLDPAPYVAAARAGTEAFSAALSLSAPYAHIDFEGFLYRAAHECAARAGDGIPVAESVAVFCRDLEAFKSRYGL